MRATAATFKLGISFENWKRPGERYIHSFGMNGKSSWLCEFHHFWLHSLTRGIQSELGDYCLELQAARRQKFATCAQSDIDEAGFGMQADVPDLALRYASHREGAHAWQYEGELFRVDSWTQVMLGQGIMPERYHHYATAMSDQDLTRFLSGLKGSIEQALARMPSHQEFLDRYCRASDMRNS